jgi:ADP-heptose:LPS heptosyltransferase
VPFQPTQHLAISHLTAVSAGLQALGYEPIPAPYTPERYPLHVAPTEEDRQWVARQFNLQGIDAAAPLVVIHPGSSVVVKRWRPEAWGACATALCRDWPGRAAVLFLLTGTTQERPLLEAIACATSARTIIFTSATVGQLAALLERSCVVLGVDSGPLHLAVAQGTPTLRIFGPTDPRRYRAWGSPQRHAVITASHSCPGCPAIPCGRLHFQAWELDYHPCVRLVPEQQVIAAIFELLSGPESAATGSFHRQPCERL